MMNIAALPLLIVVLLSSSPSWATEIKEPCSLEHSSYLSADGSRVTVQFRKITDEVGMVSDLAVEISGPKMGGAWWYIFDQGTSSKITLISTTNSGASNWNSVSDSSARPHGTASLIGLNQDGSTWLEAPTSVSRAVKYLLIPELGDAFKRYGGPDHYKTSAFILDKCNVH